MVRTTEGVIALAPDEAFCQGRAWSDVTRKVARFGGNAAAAWGECQGSGAKPYQTQADLIGPAFRCS